MGSLLRMVYGSAQSMLNIVAYSWNDVEWHTIFLVIYSGIPSVTYSGILIFQWCKVAYYFELVDGVFEALIRGRPYSAQAVLWSFLTPSPCMQNDTIVTK